MTFTTAHKGFILFSDDKPGNHATLFGPTGKKLAYRADMSVFEDDARRYSWGFEYDLPLVAGDRFVFATADREVVGEVRAGASMSTITVCSEPMVAIVERGEAGKPLSVSVAAYSEVAVVPVTEDQVAVSPMVRTVPKVLPTISASKKTNIILQGQETRTKPARGLRCMFVNPVIPYNQWGSYRAGAMNEASFSAHGSAYVSATLKADGHHCWMVDLRSMNDWGHVERALREQEFDVAFVGFLSIDVFHAAAVVRLLKELHPSKVVVVGGLHVSIAKERVFPRTDLVDYYCFGNQDLLPDSFKQFLRYKGEDRYYGERYQSADYVILDDGEIAARDLVAELSAGRRPSDRTLEGGAVPMEIARHMDRDLFDLNVEAYSPILPFQPVPMVTVTWARGCPFHCAYCNLASQISNTNVRTKPIELIGEELDDLKRRFGNNLGSVMIHDDLTFSSKAIADWCEVILQKTDGAGVPIWMQTRSGLIGKWYRKDRPFFELLCRAGLTWTSVGYESGSQRVLDFMQKDSSVEENLEAGRILNEYGINSFGNFLWGCPTETREEAEETVRLVQQIKPGFLSGSVYCNYPGTQMDKWCRDNGYLIGGTVYTRSHLPWQVTVKGIDYEHVNDCVRRAGGYANYLRMPKLMSEGRQRALVETARGLPIHAAGEG